MGPYYETRRRSNSYNARDLEENCTNILEAKMAELHKMKEDLKKAKDDAMQSWLDSRPLIDELEKLQTALASARNRSTVSNTVISELESQLETANTGIRSKKEEVLELKTMINKMNQASDETREEMEQIKLETYEERRARSKLKQVLRLRRQTLRTLQLTLRAIMLESEAFGASAAEALHHINRSETDNTTVQVTQEDYYALTRKAKEETSLADWRVSVCTEQRLVAEKGQDSAFRRLKELYSNNRSRKKKMNDGKTGNENIARKAEEDPRIRVGAKVNSRQAAMPKARAKLIPKASQRNQQQQLKRSETIDSKRLHEKKKPSIFVQLSTFLVRKITRLFG